MAQFRTAHSQFAVPFDVNVVGTVAPGAQITADNRKDAILAGDLVVYTPASAGVPAYITKATAAQLVAKKATHIVALTDMTLNGSVPTDMKDYRISKLVGATVASAPLDGTVPNKKVALYPILYWDDIIPDADGFDVKD